MEIGSDDVRHYFAAVKLDLPPVPRDLADRLRRVDEAVWSTRDDDATPYGLSAFAEEAVTTTVPDYALIGVDGYGAASRALHYYVVRSHLALLVQIGWGHAYADPTKELSHARSVLASAARLITAADAAARAGRLGSEERLVVLHSDLEKEGLWHRLDRVLTRDELMAADWTTSPDAIAEATTAIADP